MKLIVHVVGVAVITSPLLFSAIGLPAVADEGLSDTLQTLERMSALSTTSETNVLENVAPVNTRSVGPLAVDSTVNDVQIRIPENSGQPVSLESASGASIEVRLPFSDQEGNAENLLPGVVAFNNGNDSKSVPIVKDDGSVQITTIIESTNAPSNYVYEASIPPGATIEQLVNGGLIVKDHAGLLLAGIAPPWAMDANGENIPTHYMVKGNQITQVVEHHRQSVMYPVTADPWLGVNLFSRIWYDTYNGDLRVNVQKSAWGQYIHTPGAGQAVFWTAGWDELRTRAPRVLEKETLHQQYDCHVGGGFGNLAGTEWNLEKSRPNRTVDWTFGVAVHHCNWSTSDGI